MKKIPSKIQKAKALHQHWTNKHGTLVPKAAYKTLGEALAFMDKNTINKDKYHPYVCPDCGMWHIGHYKRKQHK